MQRGFNLDVKGELWALAPPALLLVVLYGHVPLVGPVAEVLAGPGLLVLGVLFVIAGPSVRPPIHILPT